MRAQTRDLQSFEIRFKFESDVLIWIRFENDMPIRKWCAIIPQTMLTHCSTTTSTFAPFVVDIYVFKSTLHVHLQYRQTNEEAQLMLTNPRDAFRGQSRSPNSSIPYVRYSILLCNSNFVFKTGYSTSKNVMTLKSGTEVTQGHWKWHHSIDSVRSPIRVL